MAIATEISAALFTNIVASTPLNCNFPLYEADEVEVVYGTQALIAVYPTDYTVQLNEAEDFEDFTITPTAALLTKINDLIADPPTEETETNFVVVRRKLDYLTSVQPETVRYTPFLSKEIDRIHMKLIQLAEKVARTLGLPANVVGDLDTEYTISAPVEGKAPVWRGNKLVAEIDAANILAAQGYAEDALASENAAQLARDEAVIAKNQALAAAAGMKRKNPVRAATTAALPSCTYANGTSGVGATLTATANGALAAQDGVTLIAGEGLLVKNQAAGLENGLYTVTQVGTAGTPFILTRQTDSDTWSDIVAAVVTVTEGSTQADLDYLCTSNAGGTIGTTSITWRAYNATIADNIVSTNKIVNSAVTTAKIADDNVTFVKIASAAIASVAEILAGTASKIVSAAGLKSAMPNALLQVVYAEYTANSNLTTQIPLDDTIPQNTEGTEVITATITPKSSTSRIRIRFSAFGGASTGAGGCVVALFKDAAADAIQASLQWFRDNDNPNQIYLEYEQISGDTNARTYKIRVGPTIANTIRLNGDDDQRYFGGAAKAVLIVEEYNA